MGVKYPNVYVPLIGEDGNAFAIIARARRAAQRAGVPGDEVAAFSTEATSGDYDHLLQTVMRWFDTLGDPDLCDYCGESEYDCEC